MDILGFLIIAAVLLLPGIGAWLLSRKTYAALKKKPSKWALTAGILVFLGTYLTTLFAIVWALAFAGLFRR